ncbi:MAG: ImmA/IrrE family metallo-endopeptidase [Methanosarcinales archaeon]|nr:ImmA/IrrE family metallo-endopeptidase [Methanosarcinales archaeon]
MILLFRGKVINLCFYLPLFLINLNSSDISLADIRGYSFFDDEYTYIIINPKDAPNDRIFSIFHEYCHF